MHGQSENVSVEEKPNTILVKKVIPLLFLTLYTENYYTFTINCLFRVETELTYSEQVMYRCLVVLNERKLQASWRLSFPNKEDKPRLQS